MLSHPGYHSLSGKISRSVDVETQEAPGRVRSSLRPDVGCGGRGCPAWLAEVGARGLRVLLALGELPHEGARFPGQIGFPDQPRSFSDRVSELRQQQTTKARSVESVWKSSPPCPRESSRGPHYETGVQRSDGSVSRGGLLARMSEQFTSRKTKETLHEQQASQHGDNRIEH